MIKTANNNRRRNRSGGAFTKLFPHVHHPARYKRKRGTSDEIDYMTFTHSPVIEYDLNADGVKSLIEKLPAERVTYGENGKVFVSTIPLADNISIKERNEDKGKEEQDKRKSYANPTVYRGKRSA